MRIINFKITPGILLAPMFFVSLGLFAQDDNLVNNSSFEKAQNKKLRKVGDIDRAEGWVSATPAKADLFSADAAMDDVKTPENVYGTEEPKTGTNYAGIKAYSYREKESRTYLQTQLTAPLKKGMRYKVQFYVSLAELSKYASNQVGAYLSKKAIGSDKKVPAIIMPETHVKHPDNPIFNAMFGWDLVCGEYTASGGEKFLTIGNFSSETDTKTDRVRKPTTMKGNQIIAAYYYVDDVSVTLLGPNEKCDCDYGDAPEAESVTLYQRSPEITGGMTLDERLAQYAIFYTSGRYDVRREGEQIIERIIKMMNEDSSMKIVVSGHSDSAEAGGAQNDVSKKRAEYIKTLLEEKGISEDRIITRDVQNARASRFIEDGDDDNLKMAKNRRVTFEKL